MELVVLLALPLAGAVLLGIFGARAWAPRLNIGASLATLVAACFLTARVIEEGSLVLIQEQSNWSMAA